MSNTAAAPSVVCDELPAVVTPTPFLPDGGENAGRNLAKTAGVVDGRIPSSALTMVLVMGF